MNDSKYIAIAEATNKGEIYSTALITGKHYLTADEPLDLGGKDTSPSPADYLCISLASCKVITMRMYANRKNWELEEIIVKAKLVKGSELESGNNTFFCEVVLKGNLTDEQKNRIMEIGKACPVQKLLGRPTDVLTELA